LEPRLNDARVTVWPKTELVSCIEDGEGELAARLTNGETLAIDHVVLATGYKVDIARLPLLVAGNILERLETKNGFPVLDDHLETSVAGLFITSMPAMQDLVFFASRFLCVHQQS
jgi:lysine/ornithine N-monooxygenase